MKKVLKYRRIITLFLVILMTLSCCNLLAFAENTVVSEDEALSIGLLYYYGNTTEEIEIHSYVTTPLYDEEGTVNYYCFDFFRYRQPKGYVVVAADMGYMLCTELAYEGSSPYHKDFLDKKETIYFNPYTTYKKSGEKTTEFFDKYNNRIKKSKVKGIKLETNNQENHRIKNAIAIAGTVPTTNGGIGVFEQSPIEWLRSLGHLNATCTSFSTLETEMRNANAMNLMYDLDQGDKEFDSGFVLSNPNHCMITAMANVLMYWRSVCCSNYPSTYDGIFEELCIESYVLDYFDPYYELNNVNGYFSGYPANVMLNVNSYFNYNGQVATSQNSWSFVTNRIASWDWPVIVSFQQPELGGGISINGNSYLGHAVVAFGYTIMETDTFGTEGTFKFLKVNDGWDLSGTGTFTPRYVSWDIVEYYDIPTNMYAFCPYR